MLATAGEIPHGPGWTFEFKWDGIRAVVSTSSRGEIRAISRNDLDISTSFPELAALGRMPSITLDGEIVALDPATGAPSFGRLQRRMHVSRPAPALVAAVPVRFFAFDLLFASASLLEVPLRVRRERLTKLIEPEGPITIPPWFDGDGDLVREAARQQNLEGVMAKRAEGVYEPGRRSRGWIKTPLFSTVECVICGYTRGEGRRAGTFGSLLLGGYAESGGLVFLGHVGTGFTDRALTVLLERLEPMRIPQSPYAEPIPQLYARKAIWVRPELVGDVTYRNLTPDGRLRHPSWRGLRPERRPDEVGVPQGIRR
jgi:bifunctional non-homologous end joining protein LigD